MRNAHGEFIWYELMTTDALAADRFYGPVAGWRIGEAVGGPVDYRMIDTGDGFVGGALTLTREMTEHGAKPIILGYIGVDDVDATVTAVETAGGKVLRPASDMDGVGRIAMVTDPQGAPFYLMRGSTDAVSTCFAPDKPGHTAWNELQTSDLDAAKQFYPAVFGWKLGDVMPMGEMGDYQFIEHGGQMIGAMMTAPSGVPTAWGFAFNNPDIDGATDRIRSAGGVVIQGPIAVPGDQRVIMANDPEGVPFMLVGK
jgi:predicted enzyme related to lactoylglutathione lyase